MRFFQTVTGTLILGKKLVSLKYAYAFERVDDETLPPKTRLHLLLADQPVAVGALEGTFGLYSLQQEGKLVGIEFQLDQCDRCRDKPSLNMTNVKHWTYPRSK